MSGVFGLVTGTPGSYDSELLSMMGTAMVHTPWSVFHTTEAPSSPLGIGQIGIGFLNAGSGPVASQSGDLLLAMAGEFYAIDGKLPAADRPAEAVALELFQRYGPDLVEHVKGAFVIAIVDELHKKLRILNDRHGLYPLFFAHYGRTFAFAPEMNGILADASFPRELDQIALLQFLRFQVVLGERTYFEHMKFLGRGSYLEFDWAENKLSIGRYWDFSHITETRIGFDEAVDSSGRLLMRGIESMTRGPGRIGVYLSGGLDSRTIAAMARSLGLPLTTITYGEPGCRDELLARRIARSIGSDHHYFPFHNGQWVKENSDFHMEVTEGYHGWNHSHGTSTLSGARGLIDVNLTGWNGGEVMRPGSSIEPWCVHPQSVSSLSARIFDLMTTRWQWPGLIEPEAMAALDETWSKRTSGLLFDSLIDEVRKLENTRPEMRAYFFILEHHSRRWTFNIVTMLRSHFEVRSPFLDYEFFDFVASLPRDHFLDRRLHRGVISRFAPQVSLIPDSHDLTLPTLTGWMRDPHAVLLRAKYRFNKHIRPWFSEPPELYADYENYLRTDLKPWAEAVLGDTQLESLGLINIDYVRSLLDRHCAAYDQWTLGKIAPFITLELMLRRYLN